MGAKTEAPLAFLDRMGHLIPHIAAAEGNKTRDQGGDGNNPFMISHHFTRILRSLGRENLYFGRWPLSRNPLLLYGNAQAFDLCLLRRLLRQ